MLGGKMNTENAKLARHTPLDRSLVPEPAKLVLILILLLGVVYLFYDNARTRRQNQDQLAMMADQIKRIEDYTRQGETNLSNRITALKTDIEDTQQVTQAELQRTAAQIQAEGQRTKKELSMALSSKADASHVEAQVEAAKSAAENKIGRVSSEVGGVKTQVVEVRNELDSARRDLEGTQRQLVDMRDSLSAAVAKNATELAQLRLKGERNYIEFTIEKKKKEIKVEDIRLVLTKTDHKKNKFNLKILVDDGQIEKKNMVINEPIMFLVGKDQIRYEVVVNWVQKNKVGGYVSIPKDKALSAQGMAPSAITP
jgi:chromosome segregation ATPase